MNIPEHIQKLYDRCCELEEHIANHDLEEFERCSICEENGEARKADIAYENAVIGWVNGICGYAARQKSCPTCGYKPSEWRGETACNDSYHSQPQPSAEWPEWKWKAWQSAFVREQYPHFQTNENALLSVGHLSDLLTTFREELSRLGYTK